MPVLIVMPNWKKKKQRLPILVWFSESKERDQSVQHVCVECKRAVECMLNQQYNSSVAVAEIKKWYFP